MEIFTIEETSKTPLFQLDNKANRVKIVGKIIAENPINFFTKIEEGIESFSSKKKEDNITVDIYIDYFNTVCSKYFLKFLRKVINSKEHANQVIINWHYDSDDTEIKESGEDYAMIINHHFNFIEVK